MNKKRNILWGIVFIFAAVLVLCNSFGCLGNVNLFSALITVIMIPIVVNGIINLSFGEIFFPIAIIGIIYDDFLGISRLTPIPILFIALFLSIGCSFLFPGRKKYKSGERVINVPDESDVNIEAKFSAGVKYINTDNLKSVNVACSFAGLKVYFDNAKIDGEEAVVNFDMNFGGTDLFIPKNWRVINDITCIIGGVDEKNAGSSIKDKTVILKGKVNFGGVTIIYV